MNTNKTPNIIDIIFSKWGAIFLTIILALLPLYRLPTYLMTFFILIYFFGVGAQSWNLMGGYTGYQSLGQGTLMGIGAYAMAGIAFHARVNPFLLIIPGGIVSAIVAIGLGWVCLRLKGLFFAIATSLLGAIVTDIITISPTEWLGGGEGISIPGFIRDPFLSTAIFYEAMLLCFIVTNIFIYWVVKTKFGLGLSSIKGDEVGAESMGVPTTRLKIMAFASSGFFYGMAGAIYGYWQGYIVGTTVFSEINSVGPLIGAYLGGIGTVIGPIIGNFIIVYVTETLRFTFAQFTTLWYVIYGVIMVLVVTFMKEGIIGYVKKRAKNIGSKIP